MTSTATVHTARSGGPATPQRGAELRSVARGGGLNMIGAVVYGASNFVLLWVLNHELGEIGAGVVLVAIAAFNIVEKTAELGCSTGLIRWISRVRAQGRPDEIGTLSRIALVPVAVSGVLGGVLLWVLARPIAELFSRGEHTSDVIAVLRAMAPFVPAAAAHSVVVQATRGFDVMWPQVSIEKIGRALALPLVALVAHRIGMSNAGVAGAWAATSLVALLISGAVYIRLVRAATADTPTLVTTPAPPAERLTRQFWVFTSARAAGQTFEVAVNWIDTLLVAALMGTTSAGIYASGTRYVLLGTFAAEAIMQVCGPRVSGLLTSGHHDEATHMLRHATGWQVMVTWPTYLLVIAFAPLLLGVFGRPVLAAEGALLWLSVGLLSYAMAGPASSVILMAGRSRVAMGNTAVAVLFNLLGNLWAIPHFGLAGAGAVWAITLQFQSWLPAVQSHRTLKTTTFGRPGLVAGLAAVGTVGLAAVAARLIIGPTWWGLLAATAVGGPAYLAVVWSQRQQLALDALLPARLMARGGTREGAIHVGSN